jgi:hypothetical protein
MQGGVKKPEGRRYYHIRCDAIGGYQSNLFLYAMTPFLFLVVVCLPTRSFSEECAKKKVMPINYLFFCCYGRRVEAQ